MKKEEILKQCRDDFISFVEECVKLKDKDGNLIDIKLNKFQKLTIEAMLRNHFKHVRSQEKYEESK